MDTNKESGPKVQFSDDKSGLVTKQSSRKTKIVVIGVVTVLLLLGAVVSASLYFSLRKTTPLRLAEVNLEDGETLTYKVEQNIEIQGGDVQKGTIRAIVSIRVLNKTSEEYWFLIKFNLSNVAGNADLKGVRSVTEYFLVRLLTGSRTPSNETGEIFEVYGHRHTNAELLRLVYGILEQLLPTVKSDLYEDVDGRKATSSKPLDPEKSPLLPGSVKMHREANTSDKDTVVIKNHFDRADLVNMPSEIDLDIKYSDVALINKSNGMVSEGHAYFSEELNFGEPIHNNDGFDVTKMKVTVTSHVSLIDTNHLGYAESKRVSLRFFVKLVITNSNIDISVHKKPSRSPKDAVSNSSHSPSNTPFPSQHPNSTNTSSIHLKRSRRAASAVAWNEAGPLYLSVEHPFTVFQKSVIGINVKGEGKVWLEDGDALEIGVSFGLNIGGINLPDIFMERYQRNQLDGKDKSTGYQWDRGVTVSIPVFVISIGVDFSLSFQVNNQLSFPPDGNSLSPVKLAVEIEPFAAVTASIEAYVSAYLIRAGAYGDGTLVRIGLPVTLSYQAARTPGRKWCVDLSARLTALKLSAGIFYQWWDWWWWDWGTRHTLYEFGTWSAINKNWKVLGRCG